MKPVTDRRSFLRHSGLCLSGLAAGISFESASEVMPTAARLDRENLLVYRDGNGQRRTVRSRIEWLKRRAEIVRGMEAIMGPLPGKEKRSPLDLQVEEETVCEGYVRRLVTYASEPGCRTPAYLLVPERALRDRSVKLPAALCLHPTDNVIGHKVVVGLGGKPNRQYAVELARRGVVTFAPAYPLLANYQPDIRALGWESGTLKAVWDNMRGLDVLESLPFVKKDRFGAIGHSLGGHNAVFTGVFDQRIRAVVSSCGLDSFLDYYSERGDAVWQPEKGWCQLRYMPRLSDYAGRLEQIPFDFHELIGSLAPRVCYISAPMKDSNFKWASVDRVIGAAEQVYKLHGAGGNLRVEHPDCEHDFPDVIREKAYAVMEKALF